MTSGVTLKITFHKTRLDENMRSVNDVSVRNAISKHRRKSGNANNLSANNRNAPAQSAVGERKRNGNANKLSVKGKSAPSRNGSERNMSV